MKINEVIIDNENGAGSVPWNDNVDYMGLRVSMQPKIFLDLAEGHIPINFVRGTGLYNHIKDSGSIGAPFLNIKFPPEWEDGDFSNYAVVTGHEGRHRMTAIFDIEGNKQVETHLFVYNYKRRHITDEMIVAMNRGMIKQSGSNLFSNNFNELDDNTKQMLEFFLVVGPLFKLLK
jgi:hypothetical protein